MSRENEYRDMIRKYRVIIDKKCVGKIKNSETKDFEIPEGEHEIYLKIDWARSNKIKFKVSSDSSIKFLCGNSIKKFRLIEILLYLTIHKNKYLWIKDISYF